MPTLSYLADYVNSKDRMTATWIFVHLVGAAFAVFHAFQKNRNHIVNIAAVDHNQIFHEKTVGGVPSAV